jgi:pimeloyl-ACP methyl ester carboxylesterase
MDIQANRLCEVAGHRLAYQQWGCGETILLLQGITTCSSIWQRLFPEFNSRYDVIAVDLLGCGHSGMPMDESDSLKSAQLPMIAG